MGRLCFLEASSKRRARVLRAVLGRVAWGGVFTAGHLRPWRAIGPVTLPTVRMRPDTSPGGEALLGRFEEIPLDTVPRALNCSECGPHSQAQPYFISPNRNCFCQHIPPPNKVWGWIDLFSPFILSCKVRGQTSQPKDGSALPSGCLAHLPTLPTYTEGSRPPAPTGCGAYENDR